MSVLLALLGVIFSGLLIILAHKTRKRSIGGHPIIAFLHPFCNAGGGGERVLWTAIAAIQKKYPHARVAIYGDRDRLSTSEVVQRVCRTFGIELSRDVTILKLWTTPLLEARYYPRLTMALQAIGMFLFSLECVLRLVPDVLIDTLGCPFGYPFFKWMRIPLIAYVHYPFISSDMALNVMKDRTAVNNRRSLASSGILKTMKLRYYDMVSYLYGKCLSDLTLTFANSTWTLQHLKSLCTVNKIQLLYPPCDIKNLSKFELLQQRSQLIVSLSQFRAEKNHEFQIEIINKLLIKFPKLRSEVRMIMIGGCRNEQDFRRVSNLKDLTKELNLDKIIDFQVNLSYDQTADLLSRASIGLHTMIEEHFGIGIVEFMSAGLIPVAHDSGGPKCDIIDRGKTGFLCLTSEEYSDTIARILATDMTDIRLSARSSAMQRFAVEIFEQNFLSSLSMVLNKMDRR